MKPEDHSTGELFPESPITFGEGFLRDHAGHIISDPRIAIVELIANAYDAGATDVQITWPDFVGGQFQIADNGTGMSLEQFNRRWRKLSYNRSKEQGADVEFPKGKKAATRVAFGQSGKGRHGAFCFSNTYFVETWRDGMRTKAKVDLVDGGAEPFHCEILEHSEFDGNGTVISAATQRKVVTDAQIRDWVGSKFLVDPGFRVAVNRQELQFLSLPDLKTKEIEVEGVGKIQVHHLHASQEDRTTRLRGITWWVRGKMVGQPSWSGLDTSGAVLDGRTALAKRVSFVIQADCIKPDVRGDWTGFHDTERSLKVREAARLQIIEDLNQMLSSTRKERKQAVLTEHKRALGSLPVLSQKIIGKYVDEVLQKCPSLSEGDLSRTVEVLAKLEDSRDGYDLLTRLSSCSTSDLDTWNKLMSEWTASNAEVVLNELGRRLKLIGDLEKLVHVATADELHDLQPLFARGLWMFGPEFEAADFTSNRGMATAIRNLLGGTDEETTSRRPDIVALPDRSVCAYCADEFDDNSEVIGIRQVAIIELKKGGFTITTEELRQGEDYASEIQKANLVQPSTKISVYVLGAELKDQRERKVENIRVIPLAYDTLLRRAHSRTFHLQKKLKAHAPVSQSDGVLNQIIESPDQIVLI